MEPRKIVDRQLLIAQPLGMAPRQEPLERCGDIARRDRTRRDRDWGKTRTRTQTVTLHHLRYSEAESEMAHVGEVMTEIPRFVAEDWLKSKFGLW